MGAFITPTDASASSAQEGAGRTARRLIDGSGWGETAPGSGLWTHTSNASEGGASMWNGEPNSTLTFDLGSVKNLAGAYIWNYNEGGGWASRSVRELRILSSSDNKVFAPVGTFTLGQASGKDDDAGQAIRFAQKIRARWIKFQILSNYRGGEMSGLSEVRFADADHAYVPSATLQWKPKYARPQHPKLKPGQVLAGAENIVYPRDAGVIDITQAPYNARGDGQTDNTSVIQQALNDHTDSGTILYFPNGTYLISDELRFSEGGHPGDKARNTVLQGQSRGGAVIQLKDSCAGYQAPRAPKAMVWTGRAPAQRFGNEIRNLTFDTGSGNAGAVGLRFIANNQGGVYDVSITSGDGQGVIGLDLGYTDEQGPCLMKNVSVQGFAIGVSLSGGVDSVTLEGIALQNQNTLGFQNAGQPCTIRNLSSLNEVPALDAAGGFTTLIGAELKGTGQARTRPAILCEAPLFARDVRTSGYKNALESKIPGREGVSQASFAQWMSKPAASLFGEPGTGLRLPIKETPQVPWDDPKNWASPLQFGAKLNDEGDDADAIQAAIDSGASTVYLPRGSYSIGHTIIIRGRVRRIVGCKAYLQVLAGLTQSKSPMFRVGEQGAAMVALDNLNTDFSNGGHFFIENNSLRTLVIRRCQINFQGADAYHGNSRGQVFLEDVVGRWFKFKNQSVWARQFNPEGNGTHIENDGGTLWILGLKTEGYGTLVDTRNGGSSEILGGLSYSVGDERDEPMFAIDATSRASISFCEVNFTNHPFPRVVQAQHNNQTSELKTDDARWRGHFTLFTAH